MLMNNKITRFWSVRQKKGEIGIEIELEGRRLPIGPFKTWWNVASDGSLRGEAVEYILKNPIARDRCKKALGYLFQHIKDNKATTINSGRAGIHVHINMQKHTMIETYNFICLYLMFEDLLVRWCGENREGNHFCLRAKDAEFIIGVLVEAAQTKYFEGFGADNLRYASINVCALPKFGSLEFRSMRSPATQDEILKWIDLLVNVKDQSLKFKHPRDIIESFSSLGQADFLRKIFGAKDAFILRKKENFEQHMLEGMWRVQEIAYAVDWDKITQEKDNKKHKEPTAPIEDRIHPDEFPTELIREGGIRIDNAVRFSNPMAIQEYANQHTEQLRAANPTVIRQRMYRQHVDIDDLEEEDR